jgi:hypothetical protein
MPEQAPYPETPWWKQDQAYPTIGFKEFETWERQNRGAVKFRGESLDKVQEEHPGGFLVDKTHKDLGKLKNKMDLLEYHPSAPYLLALPKGLTS